MINYAFIPKHNDFNIRRDHNSIIPSIYTTKVCRHFKSSGLRLINKTAVNILNRESTYIFKKMIIYITLTSSINYIVLIEVVYNTLIPTV
jgi:hypothetical protein